MSSLLCFLIFLSVSSGTTAASQDHIVVGCHVFGLDKKLIRRFPGQICSFSDDGSFLSSQGKAVVLYDKNRTEVWSKDLFAHHQINRSLDGKKYLVIGSELVRIKNKFGKFETVRSDVLNVISVSGKVLRKFSIYSQKRQFDKKFFNLALDRKFPITWDNELYDKADWELTHTNSFYEIPKNNIAKLIPAFAKGNYIINDISLMTVFVLSSDLKRVLWESHILPTDWTMLHDVQVIPFSSKLLIYDNGTKVFPHSRLIEFDLPSQKVVWQYPRDYPSGFYSKKMGGLQVLDNGHVFFNDLTSEPTINEIDLEGKIVWTMQGLVKGQTPPFQQAKRIKLDIFFKNHRAL